MKEKWEIDCGKFTITKRELLASISIIAILMLIGLLISAKISESVMDKNEVYNKAVKISSTELFQYGMKTNVGNAFIYGNLEAIDTVTYPEIGGKYMTVSKVKERYTRHTKTVTKTRKVNGKTRTYSETKVYYTWDEIDRWSTKCKKVKFLDVEFDYGTIYSPSESHITTEKESSTIRYVYYGSPTQYTGTLFTYLGDNKISNSSFYNNKTIDETVDYLESNWSIIGFWMFWILFIGLCVYAFYYLDNKWLE